MARRRNDDASGVTLLILIIIGALAVFGPIAALVWWLVCELKAREVRHIGEVGHLLATGDEAARLEAWQSTFEASLRQRELVREWASANHVPQRSDGMYDGRSRNGRDANVAFQEAADEGQDALVRRLELQSEIEGRVEFWLDRRAKLAGARAGVLWYLPIFGVDVLLLGNVWFAAALTSLLVALVIWLASKRSRAKLLSDGRRDQVGDVAPDRGLLPA